MDRTGYFDVVPGLVSIETDLSHIKGLYFDIDPQATGKKLKFNYEIRCTEDIKIPEQYSFRHGYFLFEDGIWYYERTFFSKKLSLKFSYDQKNKIIRFNKLYSLLPYQVGLILPVGAHISPIIELDLLMGGYLLLCRGAAVALNGKTYVFLAPSFNGKTKLVGLLLDKGGEYISEDKVVFDLNKKEIFSTRPCYSNLGRPTNTYLKRFDIKLNKTSHKLNSIYLFHLRTSKPADLISDGSIESYVLFNGLTFLHNPLTRSMIYKNNYFELLMAKTLKMKDFFSSCKVKRCDIFDYEFDQLILDLEKDGIGK